MTRLVDGYGRRLDYLRLSITDRCNLRCYYCMPEAGVAPRPHADILTYEELLRVARAGVALGIRHIRVTGGEPLVRRDVVGFCGELARQAGGCDLSLTTNGTLLGPLAGDLRRAGVRRVNISLDTLDAARYRDITRRGEFAAAWQGLQAALEAGFDPVKVNVVVVRGANDDEVAGFAALTARLPVHVRFIEAMPLGPVGRLAAGRHVPAAEVRARLEHALGALLPVAPGSRPAGAGPAAVYRLPGSRGTVGFIPALSACFCDRCNRLRLTADGRLLSCLCGGPEVALGPVLRGGGTDDEIIAALRSAAAQKPRRHSLGAGDAQEGGASRRTMSRLGG
jgi:cyclic pyranopterin phosphate synthase